MTEEKWNIGIRGGYSKVFSLLNTGFNVSLSLILLIVAIPFFFIIALIIKLQDGGPILYRGVRLGFNKNPFIMYKFRTLMPGAEKVIGADLLTERMASKSSLETHFGKFLRDTRLDELPQLFNILRGDMDFLGPRPERPEIYEKFCKQIKGYDKRFIVKPGLIGYSQLFTPHSSPKRIRTILDNMFLMKKQNLLWDILVVFLTIGVVLGRIVHYGSRFIWNSIVKSRVLGIYREHRKLDRVRTHNAMVYLGPKVGDTENFIDEAKLIDINEEAILVYGKRIEYTDLVLKMEVALKTFHGRRHRRKVALCHGTVYKRIKIDKDHFPYATIIKYTPVSPFNYYMVHQYLLRKSVIL